MRLKLSGPDYKGKDPVTSLEDFRKRVAAYESAYVPLGEYEEKNGIQYIKVSICSIKTWRKTPLIPTR
jgi:6-phosphofructo-2-kinase